jgi:hypothetical protein
VNLVGAALDFGELAGARAERERQHRLREWVAEPVLARIEPLLREGPVGSVIEVSELEMRVLCSLWNEERPGPLTPGPVMLSMYDGHPLMVKP